jgi:hypothetical protein
MEAYFVAYVVTVLTRQPRRGINEGKKKRMYAVGRRYDSIREGE